MTDVNNVKPVLESKKIRSSGLLQLSACLNRIAIEKKRNVRITCCEFFSHLFLLLILVFGYNLSKIIEFNASSYDSFSVMIPRTILGQSTTVNDDTSSGETSSLGRFNKVYAAFFNGPLIAPTFDEYIYAQMFLSGYFNPKTSTLVSQTSAGRSFTNLLYRGSLHFAPNSTTTRNLIRYLQKNTLTFSSIKHFIHPSEKEGVQFILNNLNIPTLALIVIREVTPKKVNYVIRQNYTTLPNTNVAIYRTAIGLNNKYQNYLLSGFMSLKRTIDDWAFQYTNACLTNKPQCGAISDFAFIPFPTYEYNSNPFYLNVGFLLGLAMVMATMYPMSRLVKSVVEEKETKIREIMKIMGLREWVHQLSWFLSAFVLFFWIALCFTFVTKRTFLLNSNIILLFLYFFLFCLSEISFSFLISVFFSNSKLASIVAPVILFGAIMPRYAFLNTENSEQAAAKTFTCILSPSAFAFGADILANYEYSGVGVQFSNIWDDQFNFGTCLIMMFFDFYIYGILALYLDQVIPHEYGTAKPLLFFLHRNYWCPSYFKSNKSESEETLLSDAIPGAVDDGSITKDPNLENIPLELLSSVKVSVKNLRKRYPDGKLAVNNLSMIMLEGQITCLLGHNGAGKTTTISTLTGLVEASGGEVSIYGNSLTDDLLSIRQMTGVCPQHNVLFPSLTVQEHLRFFGKIKGLSGKRLQEDVDHLIEDVGLTEKRHVLSSALSGGMKRKLSLAIALCGDPKFVLLDEPTSGMDPYSRRSTWELLQRSKNGRVVLLTTHFMEEADILADRIAIMSEGKMRCCGSSLFLKNRFGNGYLLTLSKSRVDASSEKIVAKVQSIVDQSKISSTVAGELVIQLPLDSVSSFPKLFQMLKECNEELEISSYGISITSLERVFITLSDVNKTDYKSGDDEDDEDFNNRGVYGHVSFFFRLLTGSFNRRIYEPLGSSTSSKAVNHDASTNASISNNNSAIELTSAYQQSEVIEDKAVIDADYNYEIPESKNVDVDNVEAKSNPQEKGTEPFIDNSPSLVSNDQKRDNLLGEVDKDYTNSRGSCCVQIIELFRKRLIIASRDLKGLFYQIIFPSLQILLVLFILTININPAGHTITLNANLYPKRAGLTPFVYYAGSHSDKIRYQLQSDPNMKTINSFADNSSVLSNYMLENYVKNVYGGYVFDDSIQVNVTIDWTWVRELVGTLNFKNITLTSAELEKTFGINLDLGTLISPNQEGSILIPKGSLSDIAKGLKIPPRIVRIINSSSLEFLNRTIYINPSTSNLNLSEIILSRLIPNRFNYSLLNLPLNSSVTIKAKSVSFNLVTEDLCFYNSTLITLIGTASMEKFCVVLNILPSGVIVNDFNQPSKYTIMHNSSSFHGIACFSGELVSQAYKMCSTYGEASLYYAKNHPLPQTTQETLEVKVILSLLTSIFILVPLCYIPASFISFIVKERVSKSKHLQIVSSVSPYLYWTAAYLWDMFLFSVLIGFIIGVMFAFGTSTLVIFVSSAEASLCLFVLLFTFGLSSLALSYLYSMGFENFSTAQISIMAIHFFTGFVFVLAFFVMSNIPLTKDLASQIVYFFRLFPTYNIGEGLINLSSFYYFQSLGYQQGSYFQINVCGRNIIYMISEAVVFFFLVLLTEFKPLLNLLHWIDKKRSVVKDGITSEIVKISNSTRMFSTTAAADSMSKGDDDVLEEAEAIDAVTKPEEYSLIVRKLVKTYPPSIFGGKPKYAVRNISFGCHNGERFGLLGINGAGKTTTLSVLTSDIRATSGEVFIGGKSLEDSSTKSLIGYCPQVDPILDLMNAYETLWFFGRIRGLPKDVLERRVQALVREIGLSKFAHRPCGTYSGGNKRKLSLGVALIGDPKVLLLDEPSTGMDPEARRHMWRIIEKVSSSRSVVLVSHSMEEVEALCTRICVMVSGKIQCIGSSQHLKERFGGGYQVEVRSEASKVGECLALCMTLMPNAVVDESHGGYFRLKVDRNLDLALVFGELEQRRETLGIYDYSVSQCTLEQIFIQFAKDQEEERGEVAGMKNNTSNVDNNDFDNVDNTDLSRNYV